MSVSIVSPADGPRGLAALEQRARFELDCLAYPARDWVPPCTYQGAPVHDAVIVGGGQSGVTIAFRLKREGVANVRVLDRNPAGLEGPWVTFARMHTLRTPKTVIGPDLGVASLTARAWWEAQHGARSWNELGKIPREAWHDYLMWVRRVAGIDVTNHAEVTDIEPLENGLFAVGATIDGRGETLIARNVVLATGIEGCGTWSVPAMIADAMPRTSYAHTADAIDFAALAGKRVAVLGAGASAFDNAAMALEAGAASVDLFARRREMPTANPYRWMEFAGFLRHFGDLDDSRKWRFMKRIFDVNQPPPQDTFERCARFAGFALHLGAPLTAVAPNEGGGVRLTVPGATHDVDFLIVGTGFAVDLARRPELARFAGEIALWRDKYQPPAGEDHAVLSGFPYLGDRFQFTEKEPGSAPFLKNVFSYTFAAMPSLAGSAGISALKFGSERLTFGVTRNLFVEDADAHLAALMAYDEPELDVAAAYRRVAPADALSDS